MRDGVLRWDVWLGVLLGLAFYWGVPAAVSPHFDPPRDNSSTLEVSEFVGEEQKMDFSNVWFVGTVTSIFGALIIAGLGKIFVIPGVIAEARAKGRNEQLLVDLAVLRSEGVRIQNIGLKPMSQTDRDAWIVQAEEWKERMYVKVAEKSNSDSITLRTLGTFPIPTIQGVTDPLQLNKLGDLMETIKRLKKLMGTYR